MLSAVRYLAVADGVLTVALIGADDIALKYVNELQAHHFAEAAAAVVLDSRSKPDERPPVTVETLPPRRIPWVWLVVAAGVVALGLAAYRQAEDKVLALGGLLTIGLGGLPPGLLSFFVYQKALAGPIEGPRRYGARPGGPVHAGPERPGALRGHRVHDDRWHHA